MLHHINYQNAGKLTIKILRKKIFMSLRKFVVLFLKAIIVFEILFRSRGHIACFTECETHVIRRVNFSYTQLGSGRSPESSL